MMTSQIGKQDGKCPARPNAFTLIELILVMAILTVAAALVTPAMSSFFRGRTQEAEAQRLLSLTHYGQNRAVAEGVPISLWLNTKAGTYGLQVEPGYVDNDPKAVGFAIDKDLKIDVTSGKRQPTAASKLPAIQFRPDGTISPTSVSAVAIQERDRPAILVAQAANGLNYEIQTPANRR